MSQSVHIYLAGFQDFVGLLHKLVDELGSSLSGRVVGSFGKRLATVNLGLRPVGVYVGDAVIQTVAAQYMDELSAARLASYHKLRAEVRSLDVRESPLLQREERARWRAIYKSLKHDPRRD